MIVLRLLAEDLLRVEIHERIVRDPRPRAAEERPRGVLPADLPRGDRRVEHPRLLAVLERLERSDLRRAGLPVLREVGGLEELLAQIAVLRVLRDRREELLRPRARDRGGRRRRGRRGSGELAALERNAERLPR